MMQDRLGGAGVDSCGDPLVWTPSLLQHSPHDGIENSRLYPGVYVREQQP